MGNSGKNHKPNSNAQRHKEAMRRKAKAEDEMAQLGLTLQSDLMAIGVILEYLTVSQLTYLGIISINEFCHKRVGVDFCIFYQHYSPPPVKLLCPLFEIHKLSEWHHPVLATSIQTCLEALDYNIPIIFFYAIDPDFIGEHNLPSNDLQRAYCDPRVRIIARHEDHRRLIETEFDIKVCGIIPDFDAEKIIELIAKETNHVADPTHQNE